MNAETRKRLFGERLAKLFRVNSSHSHFIEATQGQFLGITYFNAPSGIEGRFPAPSPEAAFNIPVHLVKPDSRRWTTWIDGKPHSAQDWQEGGVGIYDLESLPSGTRGTAFESVHFYLPRVTLNTFTDREGIRRVGSMNCPDGQRDETVFHLTKAMLPALREPNTVSQTYWEHFLLMLCSHFVKTYSGIPFKESSDRGGLSPRQKRQVRAQIHESLETGVSIDSLAKTCGLSAGHFARCFKRSFGMPVHQYQITQRIELAKALLAKDRKSISEIAVSSGFCDQAALSRTFAKMVGMSPSRWKKTAQY